MCVRRYGPPARAWEGGWFGTWRWTTSEPTIAAWENTRCYMHSTTTRQGNNTDDRRPTTDDRRPTTDDRRPTTDDRRPTTDDRRPTTDDRRPTTDDRRPITEGYNSTAAVKPNNQYTRNIYILFVTIYFTGSLENNIRLPIK